MKLNPLPPFKALLSFEATARLASFTRAANELHVTQGAISRQIALLEEFLSTTLLDRTTRSVNLTKTGEEYLVAVQKSLQPLVQATAEITHWKGKQQVTIATSTALASMWLIPRISDFNALYPDIELRIVAHDNPLETQLHDYDLAIYYFRTPPLQGQSTPLHSEEIVPVCSPGYIEQHGPINSLEDLANHTWLHLDESLTHWITWDDWFSKQNLTPLRPKRRININNYSMVIQAALSGQGIALGWKNLIDSYLQSKSLLPVINQTLCTSYKFYIVERDDELVRHKNIQPLRDWLISQIDSSEKEFSAATYASPHHSNL
ncbi:LysR substrate-binding domain-containing protein [Paenalcaligenes niemegkensis]|uniref:LysR substrate-binding domain-containing protein n=1 Tax=Paenalcaligenes niemegkensis TaxID=2895469 RepID=UPI001EE90771|nr:LysR substrate-binding domain-containing protein [Paenalcaligenes niemegkensis]MCQ9617676.1 LysR substrate-binding domain-containing protein [Paenalcaligenes niemegkensis]